MQPFESLVNKIELNLPAEQQGHAQRKNDLFCFVVWHLIGINYYPLNCKRTPLSLANHGHNFHWFAYTKIGNQKRPIGVG